MLLTGGVLAQPDPTPGPSQKVREQNFDANGLIRVHEQGTANVNVTNPISIANFPSSISVNNFPTRQNVSVTGGSLNVSVGGATLAFRYKFTLEPNHSSGLVSCDELVNVSTLHILADGDVLVSFHSHFTGAELLEVRNEDDHLTRGWTQAFTQPVPLAGLNAVCHPDSSDNCHVSISVIGSPWNF